MKQVILVRQDLKLPKGKMSAQVAHASLEAALRSDKSILDEWRNSGGKKVVLKVKDKKELFIYKDLAKATGLITAVIKDAGHTSIPAGTITCMGIGPAEEEEIDKITGSLGMI